MEDSNNIQVDDGDANIVVEQLRNMDINNDSDESSGESDDEADENSLSDEDILRRLNDPTIEAMRLAMGTTAAENRLFDALSIDWELEGGAIAENTHLKSLSITAFGQGDAQAIYGALSKNRSIKNLRMCGCPIDAGVTFTILSTFFEHNQNLRKLDIADVEFNARSSQLFVSALSKCNPTSIRKFHLYCSGMDDDLAVKLITVLGRFCNLRELYLEFDHSTIGKKWCIALGRILQNPLSKLVKLDLSNNHISNEGAAALGGGLKKNIKLKKLTLSEIESITSTGWAALFRGMSNSNSSLKELNLNDNDEIGDEGALALSGAFAGNNSLKCLDLSSIKSISTNCWIALLNSLFNPDSVLEKLSMYDNNIDDEVVAFLGAALVNNSTLKTLYFVHQNITADGWLAFFGRLSNLNSLEELNVPGNNIDDDGMTVLSNLLGNNTTLKSMNLNNNRLISPAGWQAFFNRLETCHLALEKLFLNSTLIDDAVVPSLVIALGNLSSLSSLTLCFSQSITSVGWMALSTLLMHPGSGLKKLSLESYDNNNINDYVAISFANALAHNNSLETLDFGYSNTAITDRGLEALANILCNRSSIGSIQSSNHTLTAVGDFSRRHDDVYSYLELNRNDNKAEVSRQKIISYHFSHGNNNMELFLDMELNVLPHAISWMGRNDVGRSLLYRFVSSMPALFDSDSRKVKAAGNKRK